MRLFVLSALLAGSFPAVNGRVGVSKPMLSHLNLFIGSPPTTRSTLAIDVENAIQGYDYLSYADGQDTESSTLIESPDGSSVTMVGNMWKAIPLPNPLVISPDTYIEFDFRLDEEAEVHGICLDEDRSINDKRCIQLAGVQFDSSMFRATRTSEGTTTHYRMNLGYWFESTTVAYLGLVQDSDGTADKDLAPKGAGNSTFSNISVYDQAPAALQVGYSTTDNRDGDTTITLDPKTQISISGSDDHGENFLETTDDGLAIKMHGNLYKSLPLNNAIDISVYTTMEFDFNVTEDAEFQSICLDDDLDETNAGTCCFVLGGTQSVSNKVLGQATPTVNEWRYNLDHTEEGGHTHNKVPLGYYCRGEKQYMHFIQDNDAKPNNGISYIGNIRIYEETTRTDLQVQINGATEQIAMQGGYDDQDHSTNYIEVSADGLTAEMHGNMWKALPLPEQYNVTDSTVLKFHFQNIQEAEFSGICLEEDFDFSNDKKCFAIANVQSIGDMVNVEKTPEGGEKTYKLPYGHYTTEPVKFLVLVQDNDGSSVPEGNGITKFSNIEIYERTPLDVEVNGVSMYLSTQLAYEGSQDRKYHMVDTSANGKTGTLDGNMWKALPLTQPYEITADTVLSFEFALVEQAEEIAICLDDDRDDDNKCFLVGGRDNPTDMYHAYPRTEVGGSTSYMIRVGEYYRGTANYLALVQDNDDDKFEGESSFSNIKLFEAKTCLDGTNFAMTFDECTFASFRDGIQAELDGLSTPCINDAMMEMMAMFSVNNRHELVEKVVGICSSAYGASNLPWDQVTLQEYQFDEELMDGGTKWNYEVEIDSANDNILAKDAGWISVTESRTGARGIDWPGHMHNFDECDLRAAMCCFVADRQAGNEGTCEVPYGDTCADANPLDNTDVCYMDFSRSPRSGHVRDGYSIYFDQTEGPVYCHGFAWGDDPGYAESALKGNSLFHVLSKDLYGKGYVEQIPGASMCGCVEYMPVVTNAACTKLDVEQSVTVTYEADIGQFVAKVTIENIDYVDCGEGGLKSHYETLVDNQKATAAEKAELDKYLVGDGKCEAAIIGFLGTKGLRLGEGEAPAL